FFFFQAEDGIRVFHVTGVQTCALPISMDLRMYLWNRLVNEWNVCDKLSSIAREIELDQLKDVYIDAILSGRTQGRVVVRLKEDCCSTLNGVHSHDAVMNGYSR